MFLIAVPRRSARARAEREARARGARAQGSAQLDPRSLAAKAGVSITAEDLTLRAVQRRRLQLWSITVFVVSAGTIAVALITINHEALFERFKVDDLFSWTLSVLVGGLALSFLIYVFEKEMTLRRLTEELFEEKVRAATLEAAVQRLEELDRLKSDFVATVSHELKTPLTAIIGSAKTVNSRGDQMEPRIHAELMETIERQGTKLLKLVEDVLTTAKIETGLPRMRREPMDPGALVTGVVNGLREVPIASGRVIELELPSDPRELWGDRVAMEQIVRNLIENALKYSAEGPVKVRLIEEPAATIIEVEDSGIGMAPEAVESIFERFRQIDGSTTRSIGGVGLGLYIVKNLVEAHGGRVEVDSTPGIGSIFRIHIPRRSSDRD